MSRNRLHPFLAFLSTCIGGLQGTEFLFTSTKFPFISVNFTLDLLRDGLPHLIFGHFLEGVHFLSQSLEAVPNLCSLETKLRLDLSTNLGLTLSDVDERFVAHDFLTLLQLALQLSGDFLFLSGFEFLEFLFHLDFQFESGFLFEEVQVGFMGQPVVAKLCINLRHDGLASCGFTGLEFKVKPFGPILLVGAVLCLKLFSQFGFPLVPVTGQSVLNFCFPCVAVRTEFVFFAMLKFHLDLRLQAA